MWSSFWLTLVSQAHALRSTRDVPLDAVEISGISARAHALRAVIVRLCYKDFLTSNLADRKGHSEHKSYFIETYLADSGDRDRSESPGRSTMRDRIDGSRKWKSQRSNHPPFSTYYFTERADYRCSAVSGTATGTSLSLAVTAHTLH